MKNLLLWVMMACLSIILALSACQMEEPQEILEQPPSAFSGEGSSGPEVPEGVSFVEIEIPESSSSEAEETQVETFMVEVESEAGEIYTGYVRITLPVDFDGKIVKYEVSSDLAESTGISPDIWVENEANVQKAADCDCSDKTGLRRVGCISKCVLNILYESGFIIYGIIFLASQP